MSASIIIRDGAAHAGRGRGAPAQGVSDPEGGIRYVGRAVEKEEEKEEQQGAGTPQVDRLSQNQGTSRCLGTARGR